MRDEIEKSFLYICLTIRILQLRKYNRFQLKLELMIYKKITIKFLLFFFLISLNIASRTCFI